MGSTRNRRASRQAAGFTTTTTTTASRVTGRSSAGARPATARSAGAPLDTPPDAPLDTPHDAPKRDTRKREAPEGAPRASLYDDVTNRIVAELEAGRFPWVQPWAQPCGLAASGGPAPGLPRNARTGRRYSGVNILILWGAVIAHGYPGQGWLTFRQALDAGGSVRKGERGTCVVYADRFTPEAERARALEQGEDARAIPFLKRFTVFNVAQCDGLDADLAREPVPLPEREIVPVAEQVIAASGVDFRVGGPRAFYAPSRDFVQVPPQPAFSSRSIITAPASTS